MLNKNRLQSLPAVGLLAIAFAALTVGCAPKLDTAKANFCRDLGDYVAAVNNLNALTDNSTVEEYKKLQENLDKASSKLESSANTLDHAEGKAIANSQKEFSRAVNSISNKETLAAANVDIDVATTKLINDYLKVTNVVCTYDGK